MTLDCGARLRRMTVAYRTYGTLNAARSNAVLVCHALTGDQYVAERHPVTGKEGWWDMVVGPGRPIDTDRYFVICANVLGGCMGTTGPRSLRDDGAGPWGTDFPPVTIHDMVRAQKMLIDHLGITRLFAVLGGSMGGMQVLQWAASYPDAVFAALPIACAAYHSAQNIAFHEVGRQAIFADPDWQGGRYWASGRIPARGLAVARMCAHITYLSEEALTRKFGRRLQNAPKDPSEAISLFGEMFEVESYLRHQGIHLRAAVRCEFVSDDHAGDGLLRPGGGLRRRSGECVPRHEDAVPAGVVHLRLAVPDGGEPRDRAGAEPGGGERVVRGDPHRQGARRVPAGRAGFPPHAGGVPGRVRGACGAGGVGVAYLRPGCSCASLPRFPGSPRRSTSSCARLAHRYSPSVPSSQYNASTRPGTVGRFLRQSPPLRQPRSVPCRKS